MLIETSTKKSKKFRQTRLAKHKITFLWYKIREMRKQGLIEWLTENSNNIIILCWDTIWFLDEEDALTFKLRWM